MEEKVFPDHQSGPLYERFTNEYNTHYKTLCAYVYRLVRDKNAAEDIVQNSFMRLWEQRNKIDFSYGLEALLYKIVRNATYDYLLKVKKHLPETNIAGILPDTDLLNAKIYAETMVEIYSLIGQLPPRCNDIFRRLYLQGKDHAEVARELKITESTIRTQKAKAISFIKGHIYRLGMLLFFYLPLHF